MTISATQERYLVEKRMAYDVVHHRHTGSSHETAQAAEVAEDHIAKAVLVKDTRGYVLVVIPANHWLKMDAVRSELDRDLYLATEAEVTALFADCDPGAVPPLGPAYGLETLLDASLASLADVYFEAGDHELLVHISGDDFMSLLAGARRGYFSHEA